MWSVLSDFAAYRSWNTFIISAEAPEGLEVGKSVRVTIQPPGKGPSKFTPRLLTVAAAGPTHELRWRGCPSLGSSWASTTSR